MDAELDAALRQCGLSARWHFLLKQVDIWSMDDFHEKIHDKRVIEALQLRVRDDEVEALARLIIGEAYPKLPEQSHINMASVKQDDEPPVPDNHCLMFYLQNSGLDTAKYCSVFTNEGVLTLKDLQKTFSEGKFSKLLDKLSGIDEGDFQGLLEKSISDAVEHEEILNKLGLVKYFPEKISLQTVMKKYTNKLVDLHDIPWCFLSKIMMLDYRGRDYSLPEIKNNEVESESNGTSGVDLLEDMFADLEASGTEASSSGLHPLDVVIAVFQCCSNFLRQILCEKVFTCKLSIPLVLPQFLNRKSLLMLWSLRNIIIEYKTLNEEYQESSMVSCETSIVSCVKLGKISRSKSQLLNEILNGQGHDTFFHRNCKNGMNDQKISKDLIEFALYLPSEKENTKDKFSKVISFVNLRGDVMLYNKNTKFLQHISNVFLVMVDVSELEKPDVISTLKSISSTTEVVMIVSKDPSTKFNAKFKDIIKKCVAEIQNQNFNVDAVFDFPVRGDGEKNIKELKGDIVLKINKSLQKKPGRILENFKDLDESLNIDVDENTLDFRKCQKMAFELVEEIKSDIIGNRTQKLPLQCKPWQEWASLSKEEHRLEKKNPNESIQNYVASLYNEKTKMRQKQLDHLQKSDKFFLTFLDNLTGIIGDDRLSYMRWLKLYLDENSRKILPGMQKEYGLKLDEISQFDKSEIPEDKKQELSDLATKLQEASFGVEHLMREIGQAYEAVAEAGDAHKQNIFANIGDLPQIMAELMLGGYPLEIMDGDASYVPLLWVQAVISELKHLLGEEKKIFVLSVLGIQSSGKSTLLNTMFGLQFSVAAGRCTRGVYAQLVPLGKDDPDMKYDYLLVVDTEGLRAPELGSGNFQHDNEIATLVIGLGDVTLVNIKGENVAEMEDVLQIVIHAVLKMKLVNKDLLLQPSCIFIHQNVSATDAGSKMKIGQQKFIETLDKVTKAAGEQEDAHNYYKFQQVINFDINKHVFYISDLWKGDLPMACANPGYSEKINSVKQTLLTDTMQQNGSQLTFPKLCLRVNDLWKGILCQNFVFNFKNSVAMRAYNSLEKNILDMSWLMKDNAMRWLNDKVNVILSHEGDFKQLEADSMKEIESRLQETYSQVKSKLKTFFEENDEKELLEQWRVNSDLKLKEKFEEILSITKDRLKVEIDTRVKKLVVLQDIQRHEEEINNQVQSLAKEVKLEQNLNEHNLKNMFNENWIKWMENITTDAEKGQADIYRNVVNTLLNELKQDQTLVLHILDEDRRKRIADNFSKCLQKYVAPPKNISATASITHVQKQVEELKNVIKSNVNENVASFTTEYAKKVIDLVNKMIDEILTSYENVKLSEEFRIKLSVFACQFASYEMFVTHQIEVQDTKSSNEVASCIEEIAVHCTFKETLYQTFSNQHELVRQVLGECCMLLKGKVGDFEIDVNKHIAATSGNKQEKINIIDLKHHIQCKLGKIKADVGSSKNQRFRDEHTISIMRKIDGMVEELEKIKGNYKFTKKFRIEMKVHACMFAIPEFHYKNQMYMNNADPRTIFERNKKGTYFEIFKNQCHNSKDEEALADILTQKFSEVIKSMVNRDMPRKLAQEVRLNVREVKLKSAFLPAVLNELLKKSSFEEYFLHLKDLDGSLDRWIKMFINNYIFKTNSNSGNTIYLEIASQCIDFLISQFCEAIDKVKDKSSAANRSEAFHHWLKEFHSGVNTKLPISQRELSSLAEKYRILDIATFVELLKNKLKTSKAALCKIFEEHNEIYLSEAHGDSVYSLLSQECKGCTARCPFCNAPCMLSMDNHTKEDVKHKAIEHYPLACGGMMWEDTGELLTDNCSVLVAGDLEFINSGSNYEPHLYKDYRKLYPYWDIIADPTVEASPYWKWFLMKFGDQLAKKYGAQSPDIPDAWKMISFNMAKNSLSK